MTKFEFIKFPKTLGLALLIAISGMADLKAANFSYADGNVLLCFRRTTPGGNDLIVNIGPVSTLTNLAPNTKITVSGYTGQQLGNVGTNNISWTAFAYYSASNSPASVRNMLYMSSPRVDLNTPTTPYYADSASAQGQTVSKIQVITSGALNNGNYSTTNTSTAVLEADSYSLGVSSASYDNGLGPNFDFNGSFQADPEQSTPANFTTGGTAVRADFYWMPPTPTVQNPPPDGKFLGFFELNTNGVMTYTAYPSVTVVAPVITAFARVGITNRVTFTTGSSGIYTLRGTNSAGLSTGRTNWPAVSSVAGDGGSHVLSETTTVPNKFYLITAQ